MLARAQPFACKRRVLTDWPFFMSFKYAWHGLLDTVVRQRNMRVHVTAALMVGLVGSGVRLGLAEKVTMIFCVLFVLFAEVLNTALEALTDLAISELDERARLAKDAAAGGVLVLAVGTVVIFAAVVVHNAAEVFSNPGAILRQLLTGAPLLGLCGLLMASSRLTSGRAAALGLSALGLVALQATWTESYVFSAMTAGFVVVAWAAAGRRRMRFRSAPKN